jgi:hypothetical protein
MTMAIRVLDLVTWDVAGRGRRDSVGAEAPVVIRIRASRSCARLRIGSVPGRKPSSCPRC